VPVLWAYQQPMRIEYNGLLKFTKQTGLEIFNNQDLAQFLEDGTIYRAHIVLRRETNQELAATEMKIYSNQKPPALTHNASVAKLRGLGK